MNRISDLVERVGWTALQAAIGVLAGVNIADATTDWTLVLSAAGIAALVAALKVLGVQGAQVTAVADVAEKVPAVRKWTEATSSGRTAESVVRQAARELTNR